MKDAPIDPQEQGCSRMRRLSGLEDATRIAPADARFWLFLAGCYAIWAVWAALPPLFYFQNPLAGKCCSLGVRLVVLAGPAWIYLRYIENVAPIEALRLRAAPRNVWQGLTIGLLVLAFTGVELVLLEGGRWRGLEVMKPEEWATFSASLMIAMIAEEITFRGFVYRKLRSAYAPWRAIIVSSLLFVLLHWPGWLHGLGLNLGLVGLSLGTFVCGVTFALIFEVTGALWAAIVLHFLCNVSVRLLGP